MTNEQYQKKSSLTSIYPKSNKIDALTYLSLGLSSESGEVCSKIKKIIRNKGSVLDEDSACSLIKELGDVQWYLAQLCTTLETTLSDIMKQNISKLESRAKRGKLNGEGDDR